MGTFDKVKKIVVDQLGVNEADVQIDSTFIDDLGADSLDIVELIMAFEEEFEIEIPDDAAEKIKTVRDAVDYIEKQIQYFILEHGRHRGLLFPRKAAVRRTPQKSGPQFRPSVFLRFCPIKEYEKTGNLIQIM